MFKTRVKGHHRASKKSQPKRPASKEEIEAFLQTSPKDEEGIIYFHVPYCDKICSFCSMNRSMLDGELDEYTDFLLKKIDTFANTPYIKQKRFESVYFGGGTPTILKTKHLEKILTAINEKFNISPTCEFSFESTLHNLNKNKINLMQSLGVNRYSIGIQTFSNEGRILLNRTGDKEVAIKKLSQIKEQFNGHVCIDIIYNYPNQSIKEVEEDARLSKKIGVDSASFYSLMFHEGSSLSKTISLEDYYKLDHDQALHDKFLSSMLEGDYEILEYTKVNKIGGDKYKYIRLSHKGVDILPLGIGAGGKLGKYSSFTPNKNMQMFIEVDKESEKLKLLSSLFQYPNIKLKNVKKLLSEEKFQEVYKFLEKTQKHGYLNLSDEEIIFESKGIFWGNTIASEILDIATKEDK